MNKRIYKPFVFLGIFILLVGAACLSSSSEPAPPTPTALPEPTDVPEPTELPVAEDVVIPTEEPSEALAYYIEEFEPDTTTSDNWLWFTTSGDENKFDLYTENGKLIFDLQGTNLYTYYVYDPYIYTDVRLDTKAENRGKNTNNVGLLCRISDDGWYEFSIANNGLWEIWAYDGYEEKYTSLASGGSTAINMKKGTNEFSIICNGNRLSLFINGVETHVMEERNFVFREGQVGIGVSSFDVLPINIEVDWIAIGEITN
ncbi:MAG: hypothetical protein ABFS03_04375 [Chloroflexota bacterium]